VSDEQRSRAKAINFGIIYGQALRPVAAAPHTRKQAQAFIEDYYERLPSVRAWKEQVLEQARRDGYVTTLLGRRRYVPELAGAAPAGPLGRRARGHQHAHPGSAADLVKKAMVALAPRLRREGLQARLLLQLHDELVLECPAAEAERLSVVLRDVMENALALDVPLAVTTGQGLTWADLK